MTGHVVMVQAMGFPPIEVIVFPVSLSSVREGAGIVVTDSTTATASGGAGGPYTYLWERVSGDTQILATQSESATTTFSAFLPLGSFFQSGFQCKVSDLSGFGVSAVVLVDVMGVS